MQRILLILAMGCGSVAGCARCPPVTTPPPPVCHHFQAPGFDWSQIRRILLVPLENESEYPQGTFELRESLAARLQFSGRFEIVLATPDTRIACRDAVRLNGRFDEQELLELADDYNADAVLFGSITQYHPYAPPRVGLSLRLIHPANGALIASADGLWDSRDRAVADQARLYTAQVLNDGRSLQGCDLALESPALFRRFACQQASEALLMPPPPSNAAQNQPGSNPPATGTESGPPMPSNRPYAGPFLPPPPPAPAASPDGSFPSPPALPAAPIEPPEPAPAIDPVP